MLHVSLYVFYKLVFWQLWFWEKKCPYISPHLVLIQVYELHIIEMLTSYNLSRSEDLIKYNSLYLNPHFLNMNWPETRYYARMARYNIGNENEIKVDDFSSSPHKLPINISSMYFMSCFAWHRVNKREYYFTIHALASKIRSSDFNWDMLPYSSRKYYD